MNGREPSLEKSILPAMPEQGETSRREQFSIDLDRINNVIVGMLADPATEAGALREAWATRGILTEEFVDSLEPTPDNPSPRARVQFDTMVDKALIFEKLGNTLRYLDELDTAEGFALYWHLDGVVVSIGEEIDSKVGELDDSAEALVIKLRPYTKFENREYLRTLIQDGATIEDIVRDIRNMIVDGGSDPDEVLASLGVIQN